jgi:DNA-binding transcriptional regulator YiaG
MSARQIKSLRTALGMTQSEFAANLGVKQTAVSHWEIGVRRPSGAAAILIKMLQKQAQKKKSAIFAK